MTDYANPATLTAEQNAVRDGTLEFAATVCENATSWGLSPTKKAVADSTREAMARFIRAQKSDSPERKRHENVGASRRDDTDAANSGECAPIGTNTGHGHAWKRPDGMRARCGGPAICSQCATDAALVQRCDR